MSCNVMSCACMSRHVPVTSLSRTCDELVVRHEVSPPHGPVSVEGQDHARPVTQEGWGPDDATELLLHVPPIAQPVSQLSDVPNRTAATLSRDLVTGDWTH